MINREIVYERKITGSYMKIAAVVDAGIDERLMLQKNLSGLIPVEKAYVDGGGQYWYNISGKQSLDTYCRIKEVGMTFIEQLIISICGLMERLEWNLIDSNCLMLDPELIFVSSYNQECMFMLYPGGSHTIEEEFQQLMEFLLKKTDHKDVQAVQTIYRIYERTLEDGYSILEIRNMFMRETRAALETEEEIKPIRDAKSLRDAEPAKEEKEHSKKVLFKFSEARTDNLLMVIKEKLMQWGISQKEDQKKEQVVYPDEKMEEKEASAPMIHPTVCLTNYKGQLKGELLYMGSDCLSDICIGENGIHIGSGKDADVCIPSDTISQIHARIDKWENNFYIEDLNSTNGTFVNDEMLAYKEKRKLAVNDIVQFANKRYRFH